MPHKACMLWPIPGLRPFWGGESRILGPGPPFCVQLLFFWHSGGGSMSVELVRWLPKAAFFLSYPVGTQSACPLV